MSYKPKFGLTSRNRTNKAEKGEKGIGFKLTVDNNYDIDNKRLTNTAKATENKDAINKEYFDTNIENYIRKHQEIDMNGKTIKNLSWPKENDDAIPKKYLYQNALLFDSKSNTINAKDKKIMNVLDPVDDKDVATKHYVDLTIKSSLSNEKSSFFEKSDISEWENYFELNLSLIHTIDPNIFIIKGIIKVKNDVSGRITWIGNLPVNEVNILSFFNCFHIPDSIHLNLTETSAEKYARLAIIDKNKRLIIYGVLKAKNTLYFNQVICKYSS